MPTRLVQVVGNLLHNAHKFNSADGIITVSVEAENGSGRITVGDTGIGIDPSMLGHVFDVFRQVEQGLDRSRGGSGLGFGVSERSGPFAWRHGRGGEQRHQYRRTVHHPAALVDAQTETSNIARPDSASGASRRILLIEDNRDAAESAQMLLRHEGHEVEIALDAARGST